MIYKIADFYVEINSGYPDVHNFCAKYRADDCDKADFSFTLTEADIDYEIEVSIANGLSVDFSRGYLEKLAAYRKLCEKILCDDAFLMHGALIEYEGKGYLFTAKSGTGKTTHINLWKKVFGKDKVTVVNGDKPIIRFIDDKVYAYGTPWCGKEGYNVNTRVELSGIVFLDRDKENSIRKCSDIEALPRILSQVMVTDSGDLGKQLELLDRLFAKVPTYLLKCNMDAEAAKVAYNGMNK